MRCHQQKTNVPTNQPISCSTALSSLARWNSEAPDSRSSQRVVGGEGDGDLDEVDGDRAHTTRAHAAIPGLARCAPAPKRLLQRPSWRAWEERDRTWSQSDEVRFYHGHTPDGGVALALTKATPHALFARLISRPKSAQIPMHRYRSHTCGALRETDIGSTARLSGWCHRIRDHGGVLFIDLRDHYGLTQVVADPDSKAFKLAEALRSEWVVRVDGKVRRRPAGTENPDLPTGQVEVYIDEIEVLGPAAELPMPVFG